MASNARIFFAGVGTTFLILGVGFGGGLILASSTLKQPAAYQACATAEPPSPLSDLASLRRRRPTAAAAPTVCGGISAGASEGSAADNAH